MYFEEEPGRPREQELHRGRNKALGAPWPFGFEAFLGRAVACLLATRERFLIGLNAYAQWTVMNGAPFHDARSERSIAKRHRGIRTVVLHGLAK